MRAGLPLLSPAPCCYVYVQLLPPATLQDPVANWFSLSEVQHEEVSN